MQLNWKTFKDRPLAGFRLLAYVKMNESLVITNYALCYAEWTGEVWRLETDRDVSRAKVALWCAVPPGYSTEEIVAGYRDTLPDDEWLSELVQELEVPRVSNPVDEHMKKVVAQLEDREASIQEGMAEFGLSRRELLDMIGDDREKSVAVCMQRLGCNRAKAEFVWSSVQASKDARP